MEEVDRTARRLAARLVVFTRSSSRYRPPHRPKKLSPPPHKRKPKSYGVLVQTPPSDTSFGKPEDVISRARSISESTPEVSRSIRPRHVTISGGQKTSAETEIGTQSRIHREENLAVQRGLAEKSVDVGSSKLPSPPSSNRSVTESEDGEEDITETEQIVNHISVSCGSSKRRKVCASNSRAREWYL